MISRVRGTLVRREVDSVEIMTAGGVAYEIVIPLGVYERLPRENAEVELRTLQVVREDGITLYGFSGESERAVFARLLTASGVGPRLAISMLSTMPPDRLLRAIADKDVTTLKQIPGLGTKKAERLAVELADRVTDLAVVAAGPTLKPRGADEAVRALVALGFSSTDAAAAVRDVIDANPSETGTETMIRAALAVLGRK
jgi:holliday junction DNA helicase RuvA